jgi:hypothetical protein
VHLQRIWQISGLYTLRAAIKRPAYHLSIHLPSWTASIWPLAFDRFYSENRSFRLANRLVTASITWSQPPWDSAICKAILFRHFFKNLSGSGSRTTKSQSLLFYFWTRQSWAQLSDLRHLRNLGRAIYFALPITRTAGRHSTSRPSTREKGRTRQRTPLQTHLRLDYLQVFHSTQGNCITGSPCFVSPFRDRARKSNLGKYS